MQPTNQSDFTLPITQSTEFMLGLVNNAKLLFISHFSAKNSDSAIVEAILKLELYDMVYVKKYYDAAGNQPKNYFQGWLMP